MVTNPSESDVLRVVVVLATYNEAFSVGQVLEEIAASRAKLDGYSVEVLLVDDDSPDGTAAIGTETATNLQLPLAVLAGQRNGLGYAYLRAFRHINQSPDVDIVVTMDADGQHEGKAVASLVVTLVRGDWDMVIGSRWIPGSSTPGLSWLRRINSRMANAMFRAASGATGIRDATNSLRAYRRVVIDSFDPSGLSVGGYSIQTSLVALTAAEGFRITEIPIVFRERVHGKSKLRIVDYREAVLNLVAVWKAVRRIAKAR